MQALTSNNLKKLREINMSIECKSSPGFLAIKISGRFDFSVHNDFRDALSLIDSSIKQVEIDLVNTEYLDSSALGMLLVLRDKLGNNASNISIKNAHNEVKKILEIANFDKLFSMF